MTATVLLKTARRAKGLSQAEAGSRLGVSQAYVAMLENGTRRLTQDLAQRAMKVYELPPTALPLSGSFAPRGQMTPATLAGDLAALGYPGFAYLRPPHWKPKNPGEVLLAALAMEDLEARLAEALPWLVATYSDLDWKWVVREAKLRDLQNRLGFVVCLARELAERARNEHRVQELRAVEAELERSLLAREDTFGRSSLPEPERHWLEANRPAEAKHWHVLTDWTADGLRYSVA